MPDGSAQVGLPTVSAGDFDRLAVQMRKVSLLTRIMVWVFDDPQFRLLTRFFRRFLPIVNLQKFWLVSRYDDVMEVLGRDADFPVPFEPKFRNMDSGHENFILGMPNDETYKAIHAEVLKVFRLEDIASIEAYAAQRAEALVAAAEPVIDAIAGLITQVPVDIVSRYYGIPTDHPDFALWLFAMNYYSFPHLVVEPVVEPAGLAGAANMGPLVDAAIARKKTEPPDDDTLLGRFITAQKAKPELLTDGVIRSTIVGLMLGFVPTNNRASGQILQSLLRHPDQLAAAEAAARSGDDDLLGRVLFECLRFMPINPGPFRNVAADTVIAAGQPHATKVPKGAILMVATQSASYDPRRVPHPEDFDAYRSLANNIRFGWGQHWCLGYRLAVVQMTQTFKPLLLRGNLRRVAGPKGQPGYFGLFFEHLDVTFGGSAR